MSLAFLTVLLLVGCRRIRLEKKLGPVDADFYNKVRYIMTKEENKNFPRASKGGTGAVQTGILEKTGPRPGNGRQ